MAQSAKYVKKCFEQYKRMPDGANIHNSELANHFLVSNTTVARWKRTLGYPTDQERWRRDMHWRIVCHPGFGQEGEEATVSAREVAEECGCSADVVVKLRRRNGVLPMASANVERSPTAPRLPHPRSVRDFAASIASWGRPEGIDEHLDTLPKRFSPCSG